MAAIHEASHVPKRLPLRSRRCRRCTIGEDLAVGGWFALEGNRRAAALAAAHVCHRGGSAGGVDRSGRPAARLRASTSQMQRTLELRSSATLGQEPEVILR
jgi:hypothetical protein